jgi:signal transduction histidine kinase
MPPREITQKTVWRVLVGGFAAVILLLAASSFLILRNIRSIQSSAASMRREQAVTSGLIDELQRQQASLTEVFSVLARDPDSVDFEALMGQLDDADRDLARIAAEGLHTPERDLWERLKRASDDFTAEARRLLSDEHPETFASVDLFRLHGRFLDLAGKLMERSYRKVSEAQQQIDRRARGLATESTLLLGGGLLLALLFTAATVRMALGASRRIERQAAELGEVSLHLLENQETIARRFSHELHDELGQALTAVKTNLAAMQRGANRLDDCLRLVDEAIGNVRQLSQLLRPTILDDFGLEAGLRWLCEGFAARTGIEVDFHADCPDRLADDVETHLFRIAQEALTNVARHAQASRVEVRLDRAGGVARLTVRDNGRGLSSDGGRGLGLVGMRARARGAGGVISIRSSPGQGVVIEVKVPTANETAPHPAC